jgi:ketosteroid isomerase-like protein
MLDVWSKADDVSYMGPLGDELIGWDAIRATWETQASMRMGGDVHHESLHAVAGGEIGFTVGYERGSAVVDGEAVVVDIRATNVFRLEDGAVKMIGHHTDRFLPA